MLIYSGLKLIASPALSDGDGTGFIALTVQFVVDGCRSSLELGHESVDLNGNETCKAFGLSGQLGADRAPCKRNFDEQNSQMGIAQKDLFLSYRRKGHLAKYANLEPTRNLPAFPQGEPAREPGGEAKQGKDRDRTPPARYWPNSRRPIALSRLHSGQPTGRSGSWCPGRGGLNCPKWLSVRDNQGARKLQSPFVDREMPNSRIRAKRPVPASQSGFGTAHMAFDIAGHETGVGRLQGAMVR